MLLFPFISENPQIPQEEFFYSGYVAALERLEKKVAEEEIVNPNPESGKVLDVLSSLENIVPIQDAILPKKHKRRDYSGLFIY